MVSTPFVSLFRHENWFSATTFSYLFRRPSAAQKERKKGLRRGVETAIGKHEKEREIER
jgi:hypothetical protein